MSETRDHEPSSNLHILKFVEAARKKCSPDRVHWCTGTKEEWTQFCNQLVESGTLIKLNSELRPNSYLARTHERDVDISSIESKTYVCTVNQGDSGSTNEWKEPRVAKAELDKLFSGCMRGRTMYVLPYSMGPLKSKWSKFGILCTDSLYIIVTMALKYIVGKAVLDELPDEETVLPTLHSVGMPLVKGQKDVPWPCSPDNIYVAMFPDEAVPYVAAFGSVFAFLCARSSTLRLATSGTKANPKFLATNCAVIALTSPEGDTKYIGQCMPRGTGTTGLAFDISTLPGWTQRCVSSEISWLNIGSDGRMFAVNPHAGIFGIATGNSDYNNRSIMDTIQSNTIFTNCALTHDGDVWWEGMTKEPPADLIDWTGQKWSPESGRTAAHPASRYTVSAAQCPVTDPNWNNPEGVPLSAIVFGMRVKAAFPLVFEAFNWKHGIFWGSVLDVEQREVSGKVIPEHRDPFGMAQYLGCNISNYIQNWSNLRKYMGYNSPKIFCVNLFLEEKGELLWKSGETCRINKWIYQRVSHDIEAKRSAIGYLPMLRSFDISGLHTSIDYVSKLLNVDKELILKQFPAIKSYIDSLSLPSTDLLEPLENLRQQLTLDDHQPQTTNQDLLNWVTSLGALCKPDKIYWCNGSEAEYDEMCSLLVQQGTFIRLNPELRPNSYLARSDPRDVARVESKTFICTTDKEDTGPTNNWGDPKEMKERLNKLFDGCMKGRTMYVIPFSMGPVGSPYARYGVEISDSPYVVVNMKIMTRIGTKVLSQMGNDNYLKCLHSVGYPLTAGQKDVVWPCNPENTVIAHFPEEPSVMSFGSGYGGNALLGKKCYALRIASSMARKEGWLAEHMLILGLTSPQGNRYNIVAAFPSACGKTNLAMLVPTLPGWTVRCLGDDIAWLHVAPDGTLHAMNPENGFFGVAPGTSDITNPSAMKTIKKNSIFTNVGLTPEGDVWWEGMTKTPPASLVDWTGKEWAPGCGRLAAHPNARYTVSASQCPVIDMDWENPNGVPVSAVIFGGRRNSLMPLVLEAFSWQHGVFLGSIVSSEMTAAAEGSVGEVRRDPFGMIPFCGYNMADYWKHWVDFRKFLGYSCPKIFYVNWFRRNKAGQFIWPGFGENSRVLKWICGRIGRNPISKSIRTPIGYIPATDSIDVSGLDISDQTMASLYEVDNREWLNECKLIRDFYKKFGSRVPQPLITELENLESRLNISNELPPPTNNKKLIEWVEKIRALTQPMKVHWCTGSPEEYDELTHLLVKQGTLTPLNPKLKPNCFLARSDPRDVARVESKTFICTKNKMDTGPTNNWADPEELKKKLEKLFEGCMKGRTMYVIPFCMGPLGSAYSRFGVQITDSPYVVINMKIMTRMGIKVLNLLDEKKFYLPCLHSVGKPLQPGEKDDVWPCNPENLHIAHFPEDPSVMSFGSGYGGNALLGKKSYALRIASSMARKEGWLAEHMLILSLTSPQGNKYYIVAAFPSACGKTNLAMLVPTLPGWSVRCVGDDIAWLHVGEDGRLYAINPESGFFGVASGTSSQTNLSAMETINRNSLFTNVALTPDGDVWWEGLTKTPPPELIDWTGQKWTPGCGRLAAHPNSRYTAPIAQCPVIDSEWDNANGVPICAILFGGRRERLVPLVTEAFIWEQGVFMGSIISSEQTAAAADSKVGTVRRDPMAMLPFCGYNMGDYFGNWIDFRKNLGFLSPKVFYVNWFRKSEGKFLWPGFSENGRVLKWICERVDGVGKARSTPIGYVPTHDAIDLDGLDITQEAIHKLLHVDPQLWLEEIPGIRQFYSQFGDRLPLSLKESLDSLEARLLATTAAPTGNKTLLKWVEDMKALLKPENVHWVSGTKEEYNELCDTMISSGAMVRLNPEYRPDSYLVRTHPDDTMRIENSTYIATPNKKDAGPLNLWGEPADLRKQILALLDGSMKGRTMYIIPFCMGPVGSTYARYGVQVTDSPYVVLNMLVQTRAGTEVLSVLKESQYFLPCVHSVGAPITGEQKKESWPCNPNKRMIVHFADPNNNDYSVYSYGSGFGSNAIVCRISYGLRLGSIMGRKQGWLAERCALFGITSPEGKRIYVAAALPKGCGKTALSMLVPTVPGWTVRCVGDDIAWLYVGEDGGLWAINPEAGFYDVATGMSDFTNRAGVATVQRNTIFTNVAMTPDGDVWWEGKTKTAPEKLIDWKGAEWTPASTTSASHPQSRFTVPAKQCPVIDPHWDNPNGVPISAFIFGGKRKTTYPLVTEAATWEQGVFLASAIGSDTANGVHRDPMALTPFLGYNVNDYLQNWINFRTQLGYNIPKIFVVNWFRENPATKAPFWPGFGENSRILKWVHQRTTGATGASEKVENTPIGLIPSVSALDLRGIDISAQTVSGALKVNKAEWAAEFESISQFYNTLGDDFPAALKQQLKAAQEEMNNL